MNPVPVYLFKRCYSCGRRFRWREALSFRRGGWWLIGKEMVHHECYMWHMNFIEMSGHIRNVRDVVDKILHVLNQPDPKLQAGQD